MTDQEDMKELIKKRGSCKGRLTVFASYLNGLDKQLNSREVCELQLRTNKIEALLEQYDEIQLRIECLVDDLDSQILERCEFEKLYYKNLSTAQDILSRHSKSDHEGSEKCSSFSKCNSQGNHRLVKLPTIQLPKFSGSYDNWLEFHDSFRSLIHSVDDIDDINKFHYLRASLEGTAALVIQSIEFSAKNYHIAWALLCERFDNKRLLIQNHVAALFSIESLSKESSVCLKRIIDQVNKNLRALESLGEPTTQWDTLLIHIVTQKLDAKTYREWEERKGNIDKNKSISLSMFIEFIRSRADLLETLEVSRNPQPHTSINKIVKLKSMVSVTGAHSANQSANFIKPCPKCNSDHHLNDCSQFLSLSIEQRLQLLPSYKLCYNCLRPGHYANHCRKPGCGICKRKHNILIHSSDPKPKSNTNIAFLSADGADKVSTAKERSSSSIALSAHITSAGHDVLLSTALIKVYDNNNQEHVARALLDNGSSSCLITEDLCKRLNLQTHSVNKSVLGINNSVSHTGKMIRVPMKSLNENYSNNLLCFVLPNITENLPSQQLNLKFLKLPVNINLADPNFYKPSSVDLVIGADIFWDLLGSQRILLGPGKPILYETRLGWLVSGPIYHRNTSSNSVRCNFTMVDHNLLNDDIQSQLTRFWQLDEISPKSSYYSVEEQRCEDHFVKHTTRLDDGRFCVRLPLKDSPSNLGDSFQRAKHCLLSLERRFQNKVSFKKGYCDFMSEYKSLGHMSECELTSQQLAYFIPHHGILRESSLTTKLRVVFNASSPTSSGVSLNDIQMVGPTIQDDLVSILLRFRQHNYVVVADVEKMYRQVAVHPLDRHLQQIIWRDNPTGSLKGYQLNTVTYGTASAPFLAVRCLKQLAIECEDTRIADIIAHDFFVDDLVSGGDSVEEICKIRQKVTDILASACMPLRKWRSNAPQFIFDHQDVVSSSINLNVGSKEPCKTLGLGWHPESDELCFSVAPELKTELTKRAILSVVAQVFDPLGLLSPFIISMKILLQHLWLHKLAWDDELPLDVISQWRNITRGLPNLNNIRLPRLVLSMSRSFIDLHIFTDASQSAYGACCYALSTNSNGEVIVRLLLAKSKVAPIKPTTIPRLELCGALLGTRLYVKVVKSLRAQIRHTTFWTDSTIVLGWLKTLPSKLQPFVRNRVAEILEISVNTTWRHVPSDQNPADLISRGIEATAIHSLEFWWLGPEFLRQDVSKWPSNVGCVDKLPELKPEVMLHATIETNRNNFIEFDRFSNFLRLQRSVAYMLRFVAACRKEAIATEYLSAKELKASLKVLIRISQKESFPEYNVLLQGKTLNKNSPLFKLNVFLDADKLIRLGGRLDNSDYPYDKKHPFLIQSTHIFTKLLFSYEHRRLMHAGPQLLLATIRDTFWPIGGRNLAKQCYHQCILCHRMRGKIYPPVMGNLPQQRVSSSYPFESVGVDYAGPLLTASRQGRGCRLVKVYIAVFVCFATKAIHLELVGDLTSSNFISAFKRFMARRGKPTNIFSDNGTSFVGAFNDIGKFLKLNCNSISENAANEGIAFHFIPPYAPHFGRLWEAGVKSTKFYLNRVLGNCKLTYEELYTVLVQIEALLNSRPLTPLSSDPDDVTPLTPGHFLIGRPLTSLPEPNLKDCSTSRLNRYQMIELLRQQFWTRWSKEYISELQQRAKWRTNSNSLKVDTLVILKEDNLPPLKWKLGRVVAVFPGTDGISRVADIKTANGIVRRAFSRICPLPKPSSC